LEALKDLNYAIKLHPGISGYYVNRGSAYDLLNQKQRACEDWFKAYKMGDSDAAEFLNENCGEKISM
ncbi:MAG: hypothetical protein K9J84_14925, partial [Bacteroidia bacterium]|nr:hypothetical protein [Bacteroidia bacterium]